MNYIHATVDSTPAAPLRPIPDLKSNLSIQQRLDRSASARHVFEKMHSKGTPKPTKKQAVACFIKL